MSFGANTKKMYFASNTLVEFGALLDGMRWKCGCSNQKKSYRSVVYEVPTQEYPPSAPRQRKLPSHHSPCEGICSICYVAPTALAPCTSERAEEVVLNPLGILQMRVLSVALWPSYCGVRFCVAMPNWNTQRRLALYKEDFKKRAAKHEASGIPQRG